MTFERFANKRTEELERIIQDLLKDKKEAYEQGLADAWEAARKMCRSVQRGGMTPKALLEIFGTPSTREIIIKNTVAETIAKIKAYEEKQNEIKVGDEVCRKDRKDCKFVVTAMTKDKVCFDCISKQGVFYQFCDPNLIEKTGRHFPQIEELLKAMKKE